MPEVFGGIDYERLLKILAPSSFIPKDMPYEIVVSNGTPDGVEYELEVSPPEGHLLDIYRL
ncbi:MAG: hypothetical protein Q9M13_08085, partial [Mariprofundales bacterium]|nr:hypothetical protein [Mariprofundales bacterium]